MTELGYQSPKSGYFSMILIWNRCERTIKHDHRIPDSKVPGANMGPTWVLSAPDWPYVVPMNLAIRDHAHGWSLLCFDVVRHRPSLSIFVSIFIRHWSIYTITISPCQLSNLKPMSRTNQNSKNPVHILGYIVKLQYTPHHFGRELPHTC